MVHLTSLLFYASKAPKSVREYKKLGFLDCIRVYVKGGAGGNGLPKFGGVGGQGGNVIFVAKEDYLLPDVLRTHPHKRIIATNGRNSSHNFILGTPGEDVHVNVPVGVSIYTDEGRLIGELNEPDEVVKVAKGGPGGHPKNGFLGVVGQARSVRLDLKLIADIGLVGFPNAGKSTFLKAVSHARPKIASYPFTTIKPNVGQMIFKDHRQISVADLPGLIEGAHRNQGMGHRFLKHVERTKLLLLVVDINGFQLSPQHSYRSCLDTVVLLNKELEMYNKDLLGKPTMLLVNKMDTKGANEKYDEIKSKLIDLSSHLDMFPEEFRPETSLKFQEVLPISAEKQGEDIDHVKIKLRKLLDAQAELEHEEQLKKNLNLERKQREGLQEKAKLLV